MRHYSDECPPIWGRFISHEVVTELQCENMTDISAILLDLDGTVYRGTEAIPGVNDFLSLLKKHDIPFLFVTNRGNRSPHAVAEQLMSMGIGCTADNILTSSQVVARNLNKGTRAYCLGEQGLTDTLESAGIYISDHNVDAVIVSYDRGISYDKLTKALRLINAGARFIATNTDRVITVEDGLVPEAGPLVAAVQAATQQVPEIFGKPERPIIDAALKQLGKTADECVIVGDNLHTDILAGHKSGMRSILMLTGVATRKEAEESKVRPTWIAENYQELTDILLSQNNLIV
jgi:4-nitrophenyl phosphatase